MLMKRVAEAFRELEFTTSRREMSAILSKLFQATPPQDIDKLIYLLRGRLGAPYEAPNFGVNERLILLALAKASGRPREEVERIYKRKGDLGLVAEQLLPNTGDQLDIGAVFDVLRSIAGATGVGAQQRKVSLLTDLLSQSSSVEARYITRMLQGKLRLGVGDATIMDALAAMGRGGSSVRSQIERAYSLCSDLGYVGRMLAARGEQALAQIHARTGKPILSALAERLPSPRAVIEKIGRVEAEPKYDGLRLQLHKDGNRIRVFTRRLEDVTGMFPELAKAAQWQIKAKEAILDGEAVVYNPDTGEFLPFQITVRRKRKYGIEAMEARYPLRYMVFDLLCVGNEDLTPQPLATRRHRLAAVLKWRENDPLQITPQIVTDDPGVLDRFFQECIERGLEGIVAKRPEGVYQAGQRNFNWIKLKRGYQAELRDTVDLVIVGYLVGKGKRARFGIGSLLAAVYSPKKDLFRTVTKIGSGLTEQEWTDFKAALDEDRTAVRPANVDSLIIPDVWVQPRYVVEVQADEITLSPRHTAGKEGSKAGYALRFPRIVNFRVDKGPEDATTEDEISAMYRMQVSPVGEVHQRAQRREAA